MSTSFFPSVNLEAIGKWREELPSDLRQHLLQVYGMLLLTVASAAGGAYANQYGQYGGMLSSLASFGLLFAIMGSAPSPQNLLPRLALLLSFGFLMGTSLGPALAAVVYLEDPSIVFSAFLGTALVFTCFSAAAFLAVRRSLLYLYGSLSSALSLLCLVSFANLFARSQLLFDLNLYVGLVVFIGFVLVDTQIMIERFYSGVADPVKDSLSLFLDALNIFVRLLQILRKNNNKKKNNK